MTLHYCHQQIRDEGSSVTDHVVLVDGSRVYGRHKTTLDNGLVEDDWIFECGVFAANVAPRRVYKLPNHEFI